jgi:hypothetical protein
LPEAQWFGKWPARSRVRRLRWRRATCPLRRLFQHRPEEWALDHELKAREVSPLVGTDDVASRPRRSCLDGRQLMSGPEVRQLAVPGPGSTTRARQASSY